MRHFRSLMQSKSGATAVEYGLVAAVLGLTLMAALSTYYDLMNNMFGGIANIYHNSTAQ